MTVTDQAFIRAFGQPEATPSAEACSCSVHEDGSRAEDAGGAPAGDPARAPARFQPAFQVDSFAWPGGCSRLGMVAGEPIDDLADALASGRRGGQQVVAMSGCRRGDGCTTLLLCVARRLAERGLRVAMIDADFDNPLLAKRLGLLPESGWEEVVAARLPVQEVIVESVHDRLAVLPLCGALPCEACPANDAPHPAFGLDVLREHYDLVLVDLGQFGDDAAALGGAARSIVDWTDAVVLVHNIRATPQEELDRTRRLARAAGLVEAGIAENFVDLRKSA